jgi:hypothetical protein
MTVASAVRKIKTLYTPRNTLASVTASLISGFEEGTVELELEPEAWDVLEQVKAEVVRILSTDEDVSALVAVGSPEALPGISSLVENVLSVLELLVGGEPVLQAFRHLNSIVRTAESVISPAPPLLELQAAGQRISRHERELQSTLPDLINRYVSEPLEEEFNELASHCRCLRKAAQLKLEFEAHGFLLNIGLISLLILRQQTPHLRHVFREATFDLGGSLPKALLALRIDAVIGREEVRLATFESVLRAAHGAHLHKAGLLRVVTTDKNG